MFVDCRKKNLTVLIAVKSQQQENVECVILNSLIMILDEHSTANRLLKEFQESNKQIEIEAFHFLSEMGPEEFVKTHPETRLLELESCMSVGGYICLFTIPYSKISLLKKLLTEDQKLLSESKEKAWNMP